jgi:hypothetical protein
MDSAIWHGALGVELSATSPDSAVAEDNAIVDSAMIANLFTADLPCFNSGGT